THPEQSKLQTVIGIDSLVARQMTKELLDENRHLKQFLENTHEGILELCNNRIIYANNAATQLFHLSCERLIGLTLNDILDSAYHFSLKELEDNRFAMGLYRGITVKLHGKFICIEKLVSKTASTDIFLMRDVTIQALTEEQLRRSNRALKVLSACNQVIYRASEEQYFFQQICDIIVRTGGYRMAWIGFLNNDIYKTIQNIACAGFEDGYLSEHPIRWADLEHRLGSIETAIKEKRTVVCKNINTDPSFFSWRMDAFKRGFASFTALPLIPDNHLYGLLFIYSEHQDVFDKEEIELLKNLAEDVSYGIVYLRNRIERKQAEADLKRVNEELEHKVKVRTSEILEANQLLKQENEERKRAENTLRDTLQATEKREKIVSALFDCARYVLDGPKFEDISAWMIVTCKKIVEAEFGFLILFKYKGMGNELVYVDPDMQDICKTHTFNLLIQRMADSITREPEYIPNCWNTKYADLCSACQINNYITAPLHIKDQPMGLFVIANKISGFNEDDLKITTGFAEIMSIALSNWRTLELLQIRQGQLIRSEKLAAAGKLAASIAHEINSPLQGIASLLSLMRSTYQDNPDLVENVTILNDAFYSIRNTVKNLLDLSRPGLEGKQLIDVNPIIEKTTALMKNHIKNHKVELVLNLQQSIPMIYASFQQLQQVFMNLINNAIDAITETLNIDEDTVSSTNLIGSIRICSSVSNNTILIEVQDTGPGIPDTSLAQVFDPFFTSKKTMGMGVGLSICHGIIEDHNGTIEVKNHSNGGAVFSIFLPIA
ncbi:MAG: GAF domain-containing protein, partial [Desulfobacterales bacterium]|nr:GAF domain-containing protein [Desulfobacterales bacterium]